MWIVRNIAAYTNRGARCVLSEESHWLIRCLEPRRLHPSLTDPRMARLARVSRENKSGWCSLGSSERGPQLIQRFALVAAATRGNQRNRDVRVRVHNLITGVILPNAADMQDNLYAENALLHNAYEVNPYKNNLPSSNRTKFLTNGEGEYLRLY